MLELADYIRQLPCLVCGDNTATEAAHVKYSDARAGKSHPGMGRRDNWMVPLCSSCHRLQHKEGERLWWAERFINPVEVSAYLQLACPNHEAGCQIVKSARWLVL